jgi:hypothetical protein
MNTFSKDEPLARLHGNKGDDSPSRLYGNKSELNEGLEVLNAEA